jgi:hypothetical protein
VPTLPPLGQSASREGINSDRLIGNALLSNTTAYEASRLLLEPGRDHWPPGSNALRIWDLITLIDSAVLHEQIYYLPASLPDDAGQLELRNRLAESGVLASLPKGDDHNLIGQALLASLSTARGLCKYDGTPLSFEHFRPQLMDKLGLTSVTGQTIYDKPAPAQRRELPEEDEGYASGVGVLANSFDDAARDLMGNLDYGVSGAYDDAMAGLRAMYYVFASEQYRLPYLASAAVQGVQQKFPNYFKPSETEKLYQRLAAALKTEVNTIQQEFDDDPIVIVPPFSALVLDRAATPAEIPSETLALRAEYSDFRGKMCELERDRLEARSLNDRRNAVSRIEQLGKEVARPFDQASRMKLETAVRYIPDAAEVVANPTNPAKWAKVLLGQPTEVLLAWYRRRPVAKLVQTGKAVNAMKGYDSLLTKHFGDELASDTLRLQS